jgi:hypothetical protein
MTRADLPPGGLASASARVVMLLGQLEKIEKAVLRLAAEIAGCGRAAPSKPHADAVVALWGAQIRSPSFNLVMCSPKPDFAPATRGARTGRLGRSLDRPRNRRTYIRKTRDPATLGCFAGGTESWHPTGAPLTPRVSAGRAGKTRADRPTGATERNGGSTLHGSSGRPARRGNTRPCLSSSFSSSAAVSASEVSAEPWPFPRSSRRRGTAGGCRE